MIDTSTAAMDNSKSFSVGYWANLWNVNCDECISDTRADVESNLMEAGDSDAATMKLLQPAVYMQSTLPRDLFQGRDTYKGRN